MKHQCELMPKGVEMSWSNGNIITLHNKSYKGPKIEINAGRGQKEVHGDYRRYQHKDYKGGHMICPFGLCNLSDLENREIWKPKE